MTCGEWMIWLGGAGLVLFLVITGGQHSGVSAIAISLVVILLVIAFALQIYAYRTFVKDIRRHK